MNFLLRGAIPGQLPCYLEGFDTLKNRGLFPTSVIQGNFPPQHQEVGLWEAPFLHHRSGQLQRVAHSRPRLALRGLEQLPLQALSNHLVNCPYRVAARRASERAGSREMGVAFPLLVGIRTPLVPGLGTFWGDTFKWQIIKLGVLWVTPLGKCVFKGGRMDPTIWDYVEKLRRAQKSAEPTASCLWGGGNTSPVPLFHVGCSFEANQPKSVHGSWASEAPNNF